MSVSGPDIEYHMNQANDSQEIGGRVSQLRDNWRVFEDGALAERLQSEEIAAHLGGNRRRNHQIRNDFPKALEEQTKEQNEATKQKQEQRQRLKVLEDKDAEVAQELQLKDLISDDPHSTPSKNISEVNRSLLSASDLRHRDYEVERDRVFAQKLQRLEAEHSKRLQEKRKPAVPQPQGVAVTSIKSSQSNYPTSSASINRHTPPLPVLSNGDVLPSNFIEEEGKFAVVHLIQRTKMEAKNQGLTKIINI